MDDISQKGIPEIIYYQDENNLVTNTRAVLNSQTYTLTDVTSVSLAEISAKRTGPMRTIVASIIALICLGFLGYSLILGTSHWPTGLFIGFIGFILLFVSRSIFVDSLTPIFILIALICIGLWGYVCGMVGYWGYYNVAVQLGGFLAMGYIIFFINIAGAGALSIFIGAINFANHREKPKYAVQIGNTSWESNALVSVDKALIQKIVDAIGQVIYSEEITYYQGKNAIVTNKRAILNLTTYTMTHINSASLGEVPPNRILGIIMALFGLGSLIARLSMIFTTHYSNS